MNAQQVADVLAVLVSAGVGLTVLVAVGVTASAEVRRRVLAVAPGTGTTLAALVAAGATAASLWFSEGAGLPPCELCWYQRIAMYPLVVVCGLAGLRRSATGRITAVILAAGGLVVSTWHTVIQLWPDLRSGACDPANPCSVRWVEGLGVFTIPRMAAAWFALIIVWTVTDHIASAHMEV